MPKQIAGTGAPLGNTEREHLQCDGFFRYRWDILAFVAESRLRGRVSWNQLFVKKLEESSFWKCRMTSDCFQHQVPSLSWEVIPGAMCMNYFQSPYLPPPDRAHADHFWLTSRVKRLSEVLWRKCGKKCILISCLVLFVFAFIVSFINLLPDILIGFIFGWIPYENSSETFHSLCSAVAIFIWWPSK